MTISPNDSLRNASGKRPELHDTAQAVTIGDLFSADEFEALTTGGGCEDPVTLAEEAYLAESLGLRPPRPALVSTPPPRGAAFGVLVRVSLLLAPTVIALLSLSLKTEWALAIATVTLLVAIGPRRDSRRPIPAPAVLNETEPQGEEALFSEALRHCQRRRFDLAEEQWRRLAVNSHPPSMYSLAVLYAVADARDRRARELFQALLLTAPDYRRRSLLGLAILILAHEGDVGRVRVMLADAAVTTIMSGASEQRAVRHALHLTAVLEQGSGAAARGRRGQQTRLASEFAAAVDLVNRRSGSRGKRARELGYAAPTVSRVLALALPLEARDGAVLSILPVDLLQRGSAAGLAARLVQRVPVLGLTLDGEPYPFGFVTAGSRWMIRHGFRWISVALLSLLATITSGALVAAGQFRLAALALLLGACLDMFDGRVAQLSSKDIGLGLLLDYTFDRIGDMALGIGFTLYLLSSGASPFNVTVAVVFVGVCLLASYVRAESKAFGMEGAGGLIERPHRMLLLITTLALQLPVVGLFMTTSLTLVTVAVRLRNAAQTQRDAVVNLNIQSETVPFRFISEGGARRASTP